MGNAFGIIHCERKTHAFLRNLTASKLILQQFEHTRFYLGVCSKNMTTATRNSCSYCCISQLRNTFFCGNAGEMCSKKGDDCICSNVFQNGDTEVPLAVDRARFAMVMPSCWASFIYIIWDEDLIWFSVKSLTHYVPFLP